MVNKFYKSSSDERVKAKEDGVPSYWYTCYVNTQSPVTRDSDELWISPWNGIKAITAAEMYFHDKCVISIRPASAYESCKKDSEYYKMEYFLEISNHDESVRYSSRRLYRWEEIITLASLFKGLSFTAALRVWKSKKL